MRNEGNFGTFSVRADEEGELKCELRSFENIGRFGRGYQGCIRL